jgi:hypothetical protein
VDYLLLDCDMVATWVAGWVLACCITTAVAVADNILLPESLYLSASVNAFLIQPFCAVQHGSSEKYY